MASIAAAMAASMASGLKNKGGDSKVQAFLVKMESAIRNYPLWANATNQEIDHVLENMCYWDRAIWRSRYFHCASDNTFSGGSAAKVPELTSAAGYFFRDGAEGKQTCPTLAVLAGDFLLFRAFSAAVALDNTEVVSLLATAVNNLVTGELMQLTITQVAHMVFPHLDGSSEISAEETEKFAVK